MAQQKIKPFYFFALPFLTIVLIVLFVCVVAISPFLLIGYFRNTRHRKLRRKVRSNYAPNRDKSPNK